MTRTQPRPILFCVLICGSLLLTTACSNARIRSDATAKVQARAYKAQADLQTALGKDNRPTRAELERAILAPDEPGFPIEIIGQSGTESPVFDVTIVGEADDTSFPSEGHVTVRLCVRLAVPSAGTAVQISDVGCPLGLADPAWGPVQYVVTLSDR